MKRFSALLLVFALLVITMPYSAGASGTPSADKIDQAMAQVDDCVQLIAVYNDLLEQAKAEGAVPASLTSDEYLSQMESVTNTMIEMDERLGDFPTSRADYERMTEKDIDELMRLVSVLAQLMEDATQGFLLAQTAPNEPQEAWSPSDPLLTLTQEMSNPIEIAYAFSPTHPQPQETSKYGPHNILDGSETTSWQYNASNTSGNGYRTYIVLNLASPANLNMLRIKNGFWAITSGIDQYWRNNRVKDAVISFQYEDAYAFADPIFYTFADEKKVVDISMGERQNVIAIMFQIESVYRGNKFDDVAITHIEVTGHHEHSQQAISLPSQPEGQILPFEKGKTFNVYSGPGEQYYRAANGKATVSTNDWIRVIGTDGEWMLIEYEISAGKGRRGYIHISPLLEQQQLLPIIKADLIASIDRESLLTDDPSFGQEPIVTLYPGMGAKLIHVDNGFAYIEVNTDIGLLRGYTDIDSLEF